MKRFFLLLLTVIVFVFAVSGCKADSSPTATGAPTSLPPTPTSAPPTATVTPRPTFPLEAQVTTFTVVFDNVPYDPALVTAWGFACLVETAAGTVLFDTGSDGATLLKNMERLGLDPQAIDAIVLSHYHADHLEGLRSLLDTGVEPVVYALASFPASGKDVVREYTELVEITDPLEIMPGIYTTGEVSTNVAEQALIVETAQGAVVLTGCSHPGVADMVRRAREVVESEIALVTGGFHLVEANREQIKGVIADLQDLGVQRAVPSHCSGDLAMEMFAEVFGSDLTGGLGRIITMDAE